MVNEDMKISIGRIQRALDRIEISANRFIMRGHGNPIVQIQHDTLKSEVAASVAELDQLLRALPASPDGDSSGSGNDG